MIVINYFSAVKNYGIFPNTAREREKKEKKNSRIFALRTLIALKKSTKARCMSP